MNEGVRKLVYVASPLRGDYEKNISKAKEYSKKIIEMGHIPYTPHLLFTQFMDDAIPEERELAMQMGIEMLKRCDMLMVCGGHISEGMGKEIKAANKLGIPVKFYNVPQEEEHYGQD